MIDNSKIYFKKRDTFNQKINEINPNSIVFIEEDESIWTHGHFFTGKKAIMDYVDQKYDQLLENFADPQVVENVQKIIEIVENYYSDPDIEGSRPTDFFNNNSYTKDEVYNKEEADAKFLTIEAYEGKMYPLSVSLSLEGSSLREYEAEQYTVQLAYYVTKKGNTINDSEVTLSITSGPSDARIHKNISTRKAVVNIFQPGTYTIRVDASYNGETASAQSIFTFVRPTYIGFDSENVNINNLSKSVVGSVSGVSGRTINNPTKGNYLWIITPFGKPTVATDQGFTYIVDMTDAVKTENGLHYYRSTSAVDVSELTYYIR